MHTTWILTADGSRARIFETNSKEKSLREVEEFVNSKAQQQERDINTAPKGRFSSGPGGHQAHTAEPRVDAVTHEMELFTKSVSSYLEKARNERRYDTLHVIASPKMLGLMRQSMSKEALKLVEEETAEDISRLDAREVQAYLKQHIIH